MKLMLSITLFALFTSIGLAGTPATQPTGDRQQLERAWEDLKNSDPAASRALLYFTDHPQQAVPFLREHLQPLVLSQDDLDKLIGDLASDDDAVWKAAFEKLQYLDPRLTEDLQSLMSKEMEPLSRTRLVDVLCNAKADTHIGQNNIQLVSIGKDTFQLELRTPNSMTAWGVASTLDSLSKPAWTRATRAIVALEHIGTPDAVEALRIMSQGNPDAPPTKAALEALDRVESADK